MISFIRKVERKVPDLAESTLGVYRSLLRSFGQSASKACPPIGSELEQNLERLQAAVGTADSPESLLGTRAAVEQELEKWGKAAADHFSKKAAEIKEIMIMVARTAEAVGERDSHYASEFSELSSRLHAIAGYDDVSKMRSSLVSSVGDLRGAVTRMTQDGQESVAELRSMLTVYQKRLEEAEMLATRDPLTGLANRRKAEKYLEALARGGKTVSLMLIDLNGFKAINDKLGHNVGDEVLKEFAAELKGQFRASDMVVRWGGDEFVVVLECGPADAASKAENVRKWVMGEYRVSIGGTVKKIPVKAAIGVATNSAGESYQDLISRADANMYADKKVMKQSA